MTKIMYVHGFGSSYAETGSSKIEALMNNFEVVGMSYDYTATADVNLAELSEFAQENRVDMIVGTSLGGWYAARLGAELGLPVVLINPCIDPDVSLRGYIGTHEDWYGNKYTFTEEAANSYVGFSTDAFALVLLDRGDEVIPHTKIDTVDHNFEVVRFDGGSHRFEHMLDSIELIARHAHNADVVLGA